MPDRNLGSYLNHHLAASVAWLEAVEHLQATEKATPMGRVLSDLLAEVAADRRVLEELMARLKVTESETQKATAWLGEKVLRVIQPVGQQGTGPLHLFQALEALSLGIEGRRAMWIALATTAQDNPSLKGLDYQVMVKRAEDQRERMEKLRLEAAVKAFRPGE